MSQALLAPSLSQAGPAVQIAETVQHAGWHSFDNITTLAGLAGTFYWPENPLLPSQITFTFTPGLEGYQGNFINRRGLMVEQGALFCVPNNPAIGWAALTLQPMGAPTSRSFIVQGMFTDANHRISYLLLANITPGGPQTNLLPFRSA